MVNRRTTMRVVTLSLCLFPATLQAQVPTPTINGPAATPPGLQSSFLGVSASCTGATNGAAITAGTSAPAICLYINGFFAAGSPFVNSVNWTPSGSSAVSLTVLSVSGTQIIANVPSNLFASAGTATVTVLQSVQSSSPVVSNGATFTVNPAMTPLALPPGDVGVAYSQPVFSGGTPPFTLNTQFVITPPGLSFTPSSVNPLAGVPTQAGPQSLVASITDAWGNGVTFDVNITFNPTPQIATPGLSNGVRNTAYIPATLTEIGGTAPFAWAATGLPAGLSVSPAGVLSGTPTASGNFTALVILTDAAGALVRASFPFTIYAPLTITTTSLPSGRLNTPYTTTLAATGGTSSYSWSATGLPSGLTLSLAGVLSGTPTQSGNFTANITLYDGLQTVTASLPLTILSNLSISTTNLPSGVAGTVYFAQLSASGGLAPYSWAVSGLPGGLNFNGTTGTISGTPNQAGSASIGVVLTDSSGQTARATFGLTINPAPQPPLQITTTSLPNGTVGVFYASLIGVTGGNGGPYTFTAGAGLPPGMSIATNGQLQGTPTAPGAFSFGVTASDSSGNTATGTVSITIVAAPIVITTAALSSVQAGSSFSATFAATGGVPPYTFAIGGSTPPGTSFAGATLSGVPATPGSYAFTVTVTDSAKTTSSKTFTLVVTPAPLTITATLPTGTAGVAYTGQFAAAGGTPPYSWSGTGGGGLSISSSGAVSGTPTAAGNLPLSVTVTDSQGLKASGTYSVTINPSGLKVTTSALPNGALTSAYSASLAATGGTPPYSWSASGLPNGISLASNGTFSGTPTSPGTSTVSVTVTDSTGVTASASLALTILPAPLRITTTGITPATLGTSFSVGFGATGGTPPYTWTATGLPAGVTLSSTGTLSGTPTALGSSPITVTVTDSNGQTIGETLNLTIALPAAPNVTFTGLPATANPGTQSTATVTFNAAYPVAVTVNLTLTFTPLSGAGDPNIQFSTGGRTATLSIPAGSTAASASIGVQTGTVAGTITITSQLVAAGQDITPTPAPTKTIVIAPAAPTITSVTATTNSTGFNVTFDGFDTTRSVTQVMFTFTAAAGSTLQTSSVTIPATALFSAWYQSAASAPYGSQFSFTIPFTVTGNVQGITSVTVTLVNPTGTSTSMTASL